MSHPTNNVLLIKPANFSFNEETSLSNAFQKKISDDEKVKLGELVSEEFNAFVKKLRSNGVGVTVV